MSGNQFIKMEKSAFVDAGKASAAADTELQALMKELEAVPEPMRSNTAGDFWEKFKGIMGRANMVASGLQKSLVSIQQGQAEVNTTMQQGEQQQADDADATEGKAAWDDAVFRNRG
jgi:uncharacterized protein YukE